jgi:dihydroflavonol-4-reductase
VSTALVTGATGFIGHHVARELAGHGWEVRALVRPQSRGDARWPDTSEPVPGDVLDRDAVLRAAEGCDAIFHVAAHYSLARHQAAVIERTNVTGTTNVLAAARATGARLVHTSSVSTIGIPPDGTPGDEDTPLDPAVVIGAYKRSKVASERLVAEAAREGVWAVIVNPSAPVGPGDWKPTPTGRIIRDFLNGRMRAYVDTGLNLVDVRDVAAGHRLALERGRPGRRYILGNRDMTLREILEALAAVSGRDAPTRRVPHPVAIGAAAVSELVEGRLLRREPFAPLDGALMARKRMFYSSRRAIEELGFPQSPVNDALRDAVDWWNAVGAGEPRQRAGVGR